MKYFFCLTFIIFITTKTYSQQKYKDTIYYLLDTAKMPTHDKMWSYFKESTFTGFALNCHCNPEQTNPVFQYWPRKKGTTLTVDQVRKIDLSTLNDLIDIAAGFGANKVRIRIFYFIEPIGGSYIMREMRLLWYLKPIKTD